MKQQAILAISIAALISGCGGGVSASGGKSSPAAAVKTEEPKKEEPKDKEITFSMNVNTAGAEEEEKASLALLANAPKTAILAEKLEFHIDCTAAVPAGTASDVYVAQNSAAPLTATGPATFTATVPTGCVTPVITKMFGVFPDSGIEFTLPEGGTAGTSLAYSFGTWNVHAWLDYAGTSAVYFQFDKAIVHETPAAQAAAAKATVSGPVTVTVSDACKNPAGHTVAVIAAGGTATQWVVKVPHAFDVAATQSTSVIHDNSGAYNVYSQDGVVDDGVGDNGYVQWTFDFATASLSDANVRYKLVANGPGDAQCVADVTFNLTAVGATVIPF